MNLFSEIYNCYYQVMKSILQQQHTLTLDDLRTNISKLGYEESLFFLIPKLVKSEWNLFDNQEGIFVSKLSEHFYVPLTELQKSYIKTILQDERIQLFLSADDLTALNALFADSPVLWQPEDFYDYDRFSDSDDFADSSYQKHFFCLTDAIEHQQYVDISYESKENHRIHHHYLPCRLEYSIKNNKFRLLAVKTSTNNVQTVEILNLARMKDVTPLPRFAVEPPDLNSLIRSSYYKEPVRLRIHNKRNALERAMLQFANYEKNTTKIDTDTYECLIYYNQKMETELLIEVLSFGPMLTVLGSERFLRLIRQRLHRQLSFRQPKREIHS